MFRAIWNFVIVGLIIFLASKIAPDHVWYATFGTLVIVVLLIAVVELLLMLAVALIEGIGAAFANITWILLGIAVVLFADVIAFYIIDALLDTFTMTGFWTKVIVSLCCSLFTLKKPS